MYGGTPNFSQGLIQDLPLPLPNNVIPNVNFRYTWEVSNVMWATWTMMIRLIFNGDINTPSILSVNYPLVPSNMKSIWKWRYDTRTFLQASQETTSKKGKASCRDDRNFISMEIVSITSRLSNDYLYRV
ncbi:Hypothetical predicted protein [Olea europaea subsp. europaea]|uniref:Uncharacterized protein n=1 Tax=Olea europaea subsp. europaea TaxID=158383 RepID=A0A8S0QJX5_OLEEU|nr:Hypothetical predicted protein [Olea europaea subsp. europaea]